ncbi:MAG TPA: DUF4292 domain-containing protein [Bacteroidia bacterium]|nr:DUF4292 domain-containing protein [Bacteroidia bacterium]
MPALCVWLLAGCHTTHKVSTPKVREDKSALVESAPFLEQRIDSSAFRARTFSAKADVTTKQGDNSNSFNINMRVKVDSIIWISITPLLGIEVARVMITPDSVKFIDRINKKYSVTDFEFFNKLLNINIDFEIIQGIITGNLFAYKKNKFNSVYIEEGEYILSTLSKRKLKRSLEDVDPNKTVVQDVWVNDSNYRINKLSVLDQKLQKSLLATYSEHQQTDGGLFPFKSNTVVKAGKELNIIIEYKKVNVNGDLEFPFSIPGSYENIH